MYDAGSHAKSNYPNCQRYPDLPNKQPILPADTFPCVHNTLCGSRCSRPGSYPSTPTPGHPFTGPQELPIAASKMSDEMETPAQPRTSRFKEHTNTASSIKPPPDALWQDLAIEDMIEKFNEEARAPPTRKGVAKAITPPSFGAPTVAGHTATPATAPPATNEGVGPFERFSRVFASVFGSVLGKRKAGNSDAEKEKEKEQRVLEERKQAADEAYAAMKMAREQGLLPTPKVFVRPTMTPRTHKCGEF